MTTDFKLASLLKFILTATLALLLIACGSSAPQPSAPPAMTKAEDYLRAAQNSSGEERTDLLLKACASFLQRNDKQGCDKPLDELANSTLNIRQLALYSQYRSQWYLQRNEANKALAVLDSSQLDAISSNLPIDQQLTLLELKADANDQLGRHLASVQLRLFISSMLPTNEQAQNAAALWSSLMKMDRSELDQYRLISDTNNELGAWLELALIAKDPQSDLDATIIKIDAWKQRWPQHPANKNLPKELAQIKQFASNRPQQIALLVPLSGKLANYGQAISQGFMAAHYQTTATGNKPPRIRIYDTENAANIKTLYQQAVSDGAQIVIGPLDKTEASELLQQPLTVPLLALNQSDAPSSSNNAYQFGLSPTDEVRSVVQRALSEQLPNALILAPQGEGMERITELFRQQWIAGGGKIIDEVRYDSDMQGYAYAIKRALQIQQSQNRAKQLETIIGEDVQFTPRHRQDIDMIFIVAKPAQARSIMPMLAYQYGGDLPVYSISSVFSGANDPRIDQDINKLHFPELPWLLNDSELKAALAKTDPASRQLPRMYALGIDSYRLHTRLGMLSTIQDSKFYGSTGTLSLDGNKKIQRELPIAVIQKGQLMTAPLTVKTSSSITENPPGRGNETTENPAQPFSQQGTGSSDISPSE